MLDFFLLSNLSLFVVVLVVVWLVFVVVRLILDGFGGGGGGNGDDCVSCGGSNHRFDRSLMTCRHIYLVGKNHIILGLFP